MNAKIFSALLAAIMAFSTVSAACPVAFATDDKPVSKEDTTISSEEKEKDDVSNESSESSESETTETSESEAPIENDESVPEDKPLVSLSSTALPSTEAVTVTVPEDFTPNYASKVGGSIVENHTELPAGVTIAEAAMTGTTRGVIRVVIGKEAEKNLTIDLSNLIFAAFPDDQIYEPSFKYTFNIYIDNESGHSYKYLDDSFVLRTADYGSFTYNDSFKKGTATGYDGQILPVSFYAAVHEHLAIKELFDRKSITVNELFNIADKLEAKGFTGENALYNYVLDFYNKLYEANETSLEALLKAKPQLEKELFFEGNMWRGRMKPEELRTLCYQYPELQNNIYVINKLKDGSVQFQLKWPDDKLAEFYYNLYYNDFFSFGFGEEAGKLDPKDGTDFTRTRGLADYENNAELYNQTDAYFASALNLGAEVKEGTEEAESPTLTVAFGMDGPGLGNTYYGYYQSSFYSEFQLERLPDPEKPRPRPTPDDDEEEETKPTPKPVIKEPEKLVIPQTGAAL